RPGTAPDGQSRATACRARAPRARAGRVRSAGSSPGEPEGRFDADLARVGRSFQNFFRTWRIVSGIKNFFRTSLTGTIIAAMAACGGIEPEDGEATLRVALASASGCGYTSVHVTVHSVRVHESPLATEDSLGWRVLQPEGQRRIDRVALDNGVLAERGSTSLPAGHYRQLRLVLAPNTVEQPLRNSVTTP